MKSAIAPNKKGHHMNQRPMGRILKGLFNINGSFQSYGYLPFIQYIKVGHFVTSLIMCKGLRAFWRDGIDVEVICEVCTTCCSKV